MKIVILMGVIFFNLMADSIAEIGYTSGKFISIEEDYAEVGLWVPCQDYFIDAKGFRFENDKWAGSLGLGCRKNEFGVNAYYDYRNRFHQLGAGLEWFGCSWHFRLNGYLPIGPKVRTLDKCLFDQWGDGFLAARRKVEFAYSGFDGEAEIPLMNYYDFSLFAAAGPYYFQKTHFKHMWGGFGRLELNWKERLIFQLRISCDTIHKTHVQGTVQVNLPLDSCFHRYLPVRRNSIILTDKCCNWFWNWDDN
jgi:hypothetical protein